MSDPCIVKVRKLNAAAVLPLRATEGSAAADLYAVCPPEGVVLPAHGRALIGTGLAIELPGPGYVALVFGRSGLGIKKGITLSNSVGVIDSDYRGEIRVGLANHADEPYTVQNGERIAQLAVLPVAAAVFTEAEALSETGRGEGGFGSTGKK